jgi:hypothetical protein
LFEGATRSKPYNEQRKAELLIERGRAAESQAILAKREEVPVSSPPAQAASQHNLLYLGEIPGLASPLHGPENPDCMVRLQDSNLRPPHYEGYLWLRQERRFCAKFGAKTGGKTELPKPFPNSAEHVDRRLPCESALARSVGEMRPTPDLLRHGAPSV